MMKTLLEVREFDQISCNPNFQTEYPYLPEEVFQALEDFIFSFSGKEGRADALEFFRIGYRRNVGKVISVNNYVGLIQLKNGYQVQILPKIDFGDEKDNNSVETKKIFVRMLRSMKGFSGKVFSFANLKMDQMPLFEIFINMYLQEVRALVKRGIKSAYVVKEENQNFYKGKLVVSEHIKHNTAHGERFFMSYEEYLVDRAENRLIKSTMLKLQRISKSAENQKDIRQLLVAFEMVSPSVNFQKDFSQIVIDRNTQVYDTLMSWSKVFLLDKSFSTFSGEEKARALLFPMEVVFESFVAEQLKKTLLDLEWKVSVQDKKYHLFDFPEKFALRPDIVITKDNKKQVVLDTKWKKLINNPKINYDISQADMYQMYAYSKKYNASDIWLLYPQTSEMKNHPEISFRSNDDVCVRVFFVNVANIDESLESLKQKLKMGE